MLLPSPFLPDERSHLLDGLCCVCVEYLSGLVEVIFPLLASSVMYFIILSFGHHLLFVLLFTQMSSTSRNHANLFTFSLSTLSGFFRSSVMRLLAWEMFMSFSNTSLRHQETRVWEQEQFSCILPVLLPSPLYRSHWHRGHLFGTFYHSNLRIQAYVWPKRKSLPPSEGSHFCWDFLFFSSDPWVTQEADSLVPF